MFLNIDFSIGEHSTAKVSFKVGFHKIRIRYLLCGLQRFLRSGRQEIYRELKLEKFSQFFLE